MHHLENLCANDLQKYQVCHKHFREEDYSGSLHHRFLLNTAIPFLYINNDGSVDVVDVATVSNVQQEPLQLLIKENESKQQNEVSQSMPTDVSYLQKVIQQHSEQLSEHQHLLETFNVQHIELQKEVLEIQRKTYEKDIGEKNKLQLHYEHKNNEKGEESIIQYHTNRLTKLEKQLRIMTNPNRNRRLQRKPILQNVTRTANLSPTARMLYNTSVKLRRTNTRLKRLIKRQREDRNGKVTLSMHNKVSSTDTVQHFVNMLKRNSEVPPQVYNTKS